MTRLLNESHDDYPRVVAALNDRWRVIECRDRVQWILQWRATPETCASDRWRGWAYCRTAEALKRCCTEQRIKIDPAAAAILGSLPARIENDHLAPDGLDASEARAP
jgi:hypothetical protein